MIDRCQFSKTSNKMRSILQTINQTIAGELWFEKFFDNVPRYSSRVKPETIDQNLSAQTVEHKPWCIFRNEVNVSNNDWKRTIHVFLHGYNISVLTQMNRITKFCKVANKYKSVIEVICFSVVITMVLGRLRSNINTQF